MLQTDSFRAPDGLPTPRTTLAARYVRVLLTYWSCCHQRDADLAGLVAAGHGDVPLIHLRWRCSRCRSARIDMICTSHARVLPWRTTAAVNLSPGREKQACVFCR